MQRVKRRLGNKNLLELTNKKVGRSGKITDAKLSQASVEKGQICYIDFEIRIKDSGVGISKENLSKLFMNFSRLEEHQKINQGGTGLGLSICKSLIELMGGSVSVESELGMGTTFIVSLKTKCKLP
jgi:signal transduction histidine kinase